MINLYEQRYIGAHVLSPRFDEVMKLCGGNGYFATEPGDTAAAVREAMQDGKPAVRGAQLPSRRPAKTRVVRRVNMTLAWMQGQ